MSRSCCNLVSMLFFLLFLLCEFLYYVMQIFDLLSSISDRNMLKVLLYENFALYWDTEIDVMIGIMVRLSCGGNNHPKKTQFLWKLPSSLKRHDFNCAPEFPTNRNFSDSRKEICFIILIFHSRKLCATQTTLLSIGDVCWMLNNFLKEKLLICTGVFQSTNSNKYTDLELMSMKKKSPRIRSCVSCRLSGGAK